MATKKNERTALRRYVREYLGSDIALAREVNMSKGYISKILNGAKIQPYYYELFAKALDLSIDAFCELAEVWR